MQERKSFVNTD